MRSSGTEFPVKNQYEPSCGRSGWTTYAGLDVDLLEVAVPRIAIGRSIDRSQIKLNGSVDDDQGCVIFRELELVHITLCQQSISR